MSGSWSGISTKKERKPYNPFSIRILAVCSMWIAFSWSLFGAGFHAYAFVDRSEAYVGDTVLLTVQIITSDPDRFQLGPIDDAVTLFAQVSPLPDQVRSLQPGLYERAFQIELNPIVAGAFQIDPIPLLFDGKQVSQTPKVFLDFYPTGKTYETIAGSLQHQKPLSPLWNAGFWIIIASMGAGALYMTVHVRFKKLQPVIKPTHSPANLFSIIQAYHRLKKEMEKELSSDQLKEVYTRQSTLIRDYIDQAYGIGLITSTTPEARKVFLTDDTLKHTLERRIVNTLRKCDQVRFSTRTPKKAELNRDFTRFHEVFQEILRPNDLKALAKEAGKVA